LISELLRPDADIEDSTLSHPQEEFFCLDEALPYSEKTQNGPPEIGPKIRPLFEPAVVWLELFLPQSILPQTVVTRAFLPQSILPQIVVTRAFLPQTVVARASLPQTVVARAFSNTCFLSGEL
jgi:hypothetical protein